jgi:hypothetical protein
MQIRSLRFSCWRSNAKAPLNVYPYAGEHFGEVGMIRISKGIIDLRENGACGADASLQRFLAHHFGMLVLVAKNWMAVAITIIHFIGIMI